MHKVSTPRSPCAPHAACKKAVEGLHSGRQVRHATCTNKTRVEVYQDTHAQLQVPVSACLAVATALALHCPHALAVDGPSIAQASHSHPSSQDVSRKNYSAADTDQVLVARGLADGPELMYTSQAGQAPGQVVTGLADSAATSEMFGPPDSMATGTYVPGPIEVGWQIYVGSAVAAFPFFLGAYEFGKRILIQQRCEKCGGNGLLKSGRFYRKCNECGGFFPWQGWKLFFTSTASPGNGGPLLQPRGQKSVLYKVPPKKSDDQKVAETVSSSSKSGSPGSGDGDGQAQ